ncbi:hypothetical protein MXD61_05015 [Frankia sp. AgPm24]|uniref:hypothetical protein n=1 Tax=Frankia sp. AgPm24 TaxID=631128 RepID=UPI00200D5BAC|nr:hypothetical protein [Frankia sp. AgPm24]MCK9921266.1 hypothetical protein [Frankia sp. AgPm24]
MALAGELLGFAEVKVANLFSMPSHATGDIDELGATAAGWLAARPSLESALTEAAGVLLAYGASSPSGPARTHFREQAAWLRTRLDELALPGWQVGDGPRHPSRWQRWTSREHPDIPFTEAVRRSIVPVRVNFVGSDR